MDEWDYDFAMIGRSRERGLSLGFVSSKDSEVWSLEMPGGPPTLCSSGVAERHMLPELDGWRVVTALCEPVS